MKKKITVFSIVLAVLLSFSAGVYAAPKISLYFDGKKRNANVIKMINKQPYIKLNDAVKMFGGTVSYDKKNNKYTIKSKNYKTPNTTKPITTNVFPVSVNKTSGPINFKISKVTLDEKFKFMEYSDPIKAIVFDVTITNNSNNIVGWYPNMGVSVLNTGEQLDISPIYSDDIGGDFLPNGTKKGRMVIELNRSFTNINSVKIQIDGPHNKNFETIGEDLLFDVTFR